MAIAGAYLAVVTSPSLARDIPKSDPDRLALLNVARPALNAKFVVVDMLKDGEYAYLCAFTIRPDVQGRENYDRGDGDSYLISYFTFRKGAGVWRVLDKGNGFAASPKGSPQQICGMPIKNKSDILKADFPKPY